MGGKDRDISSCRDCLIHTYIVCIQRSKTKAWPLIMCPTVHIVLSRHVPVYLNARQLGLLAS